MVISQFYPMIGGVEKQAQLLAEKFIEKGLEVQIVTGWWKWKTTRKEIVNGVPVFRNFSFWGAEGKKVHRTIGLIGGLVYTISLSVYIFIHRREFDILQVHQALYPAFISVLVGKRLLKKPVLVKTASSGLTSDIKRLRKYPVGGFQLRYLLKNQDGLVANSRAGAEEFKEIGYPESQIAYIPNGIKIPHKGKNAYEGIEKVLTIARFSYEKGVDVLLKAWAQVIQEEKRLRLLIVGSGSQESELKSLSHSLGIDECVDFVGLVPDASPYIERADLFVLPSRSEGMSNALLEAMSYGLPCVATRVGGNRELLGGEHEEILRGDYATGENGILVNPDDPKGLCGAILYFVRNQSLRERMGVKGREFVMKNYSIDQVAERYIALYRSILEKRS